MASLEQVYKAVSIEGCGQSLKANRSIQSEELIIESRPEVAVLYSDFATSHCAQCYHDIAPPSDRSQEVAPPQAAITLSWVCTDCSSFALCASCNDGSDGAAVRAWHCSGECAAFVAVPPNLRQGDSDYLRWFLRYFDHRRRGPPPRIGGVSNLEVSEKAPQEDLNPAEDSSSGAAVSSASSAGDALFMPMSQKLSLASQDTTATAEQQTLHPCPFQQLVSLEDLQIDSFKSWATSFAALLVKHAGPPDGVSVEEIAGLLMRQRVNALGFPFNHDSTLGWCLDASAARLNHSCSPNCAVVRGGTSASNPSSTGASGSREATDSPISISKSTGSNGTLEVRTIAPVDCGDELTISYLDLTDPAYGGRAEGSRNSDEQAARSAYIEEATAARRAALHEKYLFWCRCSRCTRESAPNSDAPPGAASSDSTASDGAADAVRENGAGATASEGGSGAATTAANNNARQVAVVVPEGADPGDELRVEVSDAADGDSAQTRVLRVPVPTGAVPGTKLVVTY